MYDVAVIGGGVIGTAVARELMRYDLKVTLLEKNSDVSTGATKANSGIIHAGYDAPFGTLMSKHNVAGNKLYDILSQELDIPFKRIGSLLLAFTNEELDILNELLVNGEKAGVHGLTLLNQKEVLLKEPNINPNVQGALYAPTCGIIEPWEIAIAYAENAVDNGCDLRLNFNVLSIDKTKNGFDIFSESEKISTLTVVNCAGIHADSISKLVDQHSKIQIKPISGTYYLLDKSASNHVGHVIFPCPTNKGKGTLVLPTIDGNLLVGPDAEPLGDDQKENTSTEYQRLERVKDLASKMVKDIPFDAMITSFSGLRASDRSRDFIIGESEVKGFYNAAGIKSPGLSCAPSIGETLAKLIAQNIGGVNYNKQFNPYRRPRIRFLHLSEAEKQELIQKNSSFAHVVCRCEQITEGEVIDVIKRNVGAMSLNGVKRRCRPGAGRCQGGFCSPRIIQLLAQHLNKDWTEINLENKGSNLLIKPLKIPGGGSL